MEIKAPLIKRGRSSEYRKTCCKLALIAFIVVMLCNFTKIGQI